MKRNRFEYLWGDRIVFGDDTFEFGSITGNQIAYKLSDVTNNDESEYPVFSALRVI
ncbi:hypothetical protein OH492_16755 [Vibrio chagasii]|nr:hypothetical protein [Vibrio chagasii]